MFYFGSKSSFSGGVGGIKFEFWWAGKLIFWEFDGTGRVGREGLDGRGTKVSFKNLHTLLVYR